MPFEMTGHGVVMHPYSQGAPTGGGFENPGFFTPPMNPFAGPQFRGGALPPDLTQPQNPGMPDLNPANGRQVPGEGRARPSMEAGAPRAKKKATAGLSERPSTARPGEPITPEPTCGADPFARYTTGGTACYTFVNNSPLFGIGSAVPDMPSGFPGASGVAPSFQTTPQPGFVPSFNTGQGTGFV